MNGNWKSVIIHDRGYTTIEKKIIQFAFRKIKEINPKNKSKHISILFRGKDLVEFGLNDESAVYTHFFGYFSNHSEYEVIRKFLRFNTSKTLSKMTMYNCRINRYNEIVNSRPCNRCQHLIEFFPLKNLFYTDENGEFQKWV